MNDPTLQRADTPLVVHPIGRVRSPLSHRDEAPHQGDEGAPDADLDIESRWLPALEGMQVGDRMIVVTWLHEADRETVSVRPRGDPTRAPTGVFVTRSPDRPNPIGLHDVTVIAIDGSRVRVAGLEAIDGTPIVDLKPPLKPATMR